MQVFLLNATTQSSGLTLVAATHVFLVEPNLNPAIERQAIHRVHRIGQTRATTVHRLIMRDTVELKVLQINQSRALPSPSQAPAGALASPAPDPRTPTSVPDHRTGPWHARARPRSGWPNLRQIVLTMSPSFACAHALWFLVLSPTAQATLKTWWRTIFASCSIWISCRLRPPRPPKRR